MKRAYFRALISATSKHEAKTIVRALTERKLIAGALITGGSSCYWWRDRIVEKTYFNVSAFAPGRSKQRIIRAVEALHEDETPIVAFFKIEHANAKFLRWIDENTCSPA